MEFEYDKQLIAQSIVDIPQIGSFAFKAENDMGDVYFMVVRTSLGKSHIATCGPVLPGIEEIPNGFNVNLTIMDYNEKKLIKHISMFLNDRMKGIYKVDLIPFEDALNEFRDLGLYMREKFEEV